MLHGMKRCIKLNRYNTLPFNYVWSPWVFQPAVPLKFRFKTQSYWIIQFYLFKGARLCCVSVLTLQRNRGNTLACCLGQYLVMDSCWLWNSPIAAPCLGLLFGFCVYSQEEGISASPAAGKEKAEKILKHAGPPLSSCFCWFTKIWPEDFGTASVIFWNSEKMLTTSYSYCTWFGGISWLFAHLHIRIAAKTRRNIKPWPWQYGHFIDNCRMWYMLPTCRIKVPK